MIKKHVEEVEIVTVCASHWGLASKCKVFPLLLRAGGGHLRFNVFKHLNDSDVS